MLIYLQIKHLSCQFYCRLLSFCFRQDQQAWVNGSKPRTENSFRTYENDRKRREEKRGKKKPSWPAMRGVRGEPGGAAMVAASGRSWRGWSNGRDNERGRGRGRVIEKTALAPFMSKASSTGYWRWGLEEEVGAGALYDDGYQPTKQSARSKTSLITPSYICRCYNKGMVRIYNHCHGILA